MKINARTLIDFRSDKINQQVDRKNRRVLVGSGAFARTRMRSRMRSGGKRGKVSNPGEYPRYHGRGLLKRMIRFGYEPNAQSVIIGPEYLNQKRRSIKKQPFIRGRRSIVQSKIRNTLAEFIDQGGTAMIVTEYQNGDVLRRKIDYKPRPYTELTMGPAMEEFRKKMATIPL